MLTVPLALGAFATACSSGSNESEAAADAERPLLEFAQCMRANGVPGFPDPTAQTDGSFGFERPRDASPEALDQALERCQAAAEAAGIPLAPGAAQDPAAQDAVLEFARCMRQNGVAEFPDPSPRGDFHDLFAGINPNAPRVQRAMQSCQSYLAQIFGHGG